MVLLPKPQPAGSPAPRPPSEMDAQAQRALEIASGDVMKEVLDPGSRPSSGGSASSRGPWITDGAAAAEHSAGGPTDGSRSGGSLPRSGATPRDRPRTSGSQQVPGRAGMSRRPATSQSARSTNRLARLSMQRTVLSERMYGNLRPRTASYSTWRSFGSDTEGVHPRIYAPVPLQRMSCDDARRRAVAEDAKFGSTMRRQRMDRERTRELDVYRRAFKMLDADRSGTVEPGEIMTMLRKMGRAPEGSKFWKTFNALDEDGSAELDFAEFTAIMDTFPKSTRVLGDGFRHIADMQASSGSHHRLPKEHRKPSVPTQPRSGQRPPVARQQAQRGTVQNQAGSSWLGDALELKRQVADIYATMSSLRQQSVRTRILDPPENAQLRTKEGRRQADRALTSARAVRAEKVPQNSDGEGGGQDAEGAGRRRTGRDRARTLSTMKRASGATATMHLLRQNVAPEAETERRKAVLAAVDKSTEKADALALSTNDAMQQFADLFAGAH